MSQELICRNPVLQQLQSEGYEIEVRDGLLIVHHIPYLNNKAEMLSGTLIMPLITSGDIVKKPRDHTARWAGQQPCNSDGTIISSLVNSRQQQNHGKGLISDYYLSCCPDTINRYEDYHEKVSTYFNMISAPAQNFDYTRFRQLRETIITHSESSALCYDDTNSSRAGIVGVNEKLSSQKVAIVGLGGTGSYQLDYLAKTEVSEIHLYDDDTFDTHNAFRGPGAPSLEQLRLQPLKVDYWSEIYSRMHSGIIKHNIRITKDNQSELTDKDMVFICVDSPSVRNSISAYLAENEIPFIDSGMGLECSNNSLNGLVRVTAGFHGHYNHLKEAYGDDFADVEDDVYKSNIQIAELNSLAAILSIIKWKKMLGVYNDYSGGSLNLIYSVASDKIIHQKHED